jgi:hypothetical protein
MHTNTNVSAAISCASALPADLNVEENPVKGSSLSNVGTGAGAASPIIYRARECLLCVCCLPLPHLLLSLPLVGFSLQSLTKGLNLAKRQLRTKVSNRTHLLPQPLQQRGFILSLRQHHSLTTRWPSAHACSSCAGHFGSGGFERQSSVDVV